MLSPPKVPIAVAHIAMFESSGSYRVITHPAGVPLLLILGKDHVVRCFHNVCRHRAYPVVSTRSVGRTPLLSCKYHGWTYDLQGKLIKAPKFDTVQGFPKDEISLYEIYTEIDANGVVFVDLSRQATVQDPVNVKKIDKKPVRSWEVEAHFNWKIGGKQLPPSPICHSVGLTRDRICRRFYNPVPRCRSAFKTTNVRVPPAT